MSISAYLQSPMRRLQSETCNPVTQLGVTRCDDPLRIEREGRETHASCRVVSRDVGLREISSRSSILCTWSIPLLFSSPCRHAGRQLSILPSGSHPRLRRRPPCYRPTTRLVPTHARFQPKSSLPIPTERAQTAGTVPSTKTISPQNGSQSTPGCFKEYAIPFPLSCLSLFSNLPHFRLASNRLWTHRRPIYSHRSTHRSTGQFLPLIYFCAQPPQTSAKTTLSPIFLLTTSHNFS